MKHILHFSLLVITLFYFFTTTAQERQPWKNIADVVSHQDLRPGEQAKGYSLDRGLASSILATSSYRSAGGRALKTGNTLSFPSPEGPLESFRVVRTRVLSEELAAKFPEVRSYQGTSLSHPGRRIYFSLDKTGFHGMIRDGGATWYLNPVATGSNQIYLASKSQLNPQGYQCKTEGKIVSETREKTQTQLRSFNDGVLRTFRLALACTGEYANYHASRAGVSSGTDSQKKEAVLSAMNTTMTRVNGIFENDLAITMQLIQNNDELIFLNPNTDDLDNEDGSTLLNQIQGVIDNIIGFNNYDIGHVFSTGGGGIAQVASPCTSNKARGVTGLGIPEGDLFDIDFVAHEMGHQFGATHTFNNSCGDNRSGNTAVEPGSGSTIMAYAGICPPNVTGQSDDYFHAISIQQIWENITNGNSTCAAVTSLPNTPPALTPPTNYVIPAGTPFVLQAIATDTDNDPLTYCWEQQDNEVTPQPPQSTATEGPVFRSRLPDTSPNRYFPNPEDLFINNLSPEWESLPTVSRDLRFSILVRDNNENGGQSARADMTVEVVNTQQPFRVTSQTTPTTLAASQSETITWEVGATNTEPFNTTMVDIYLIVNGDLDNPVSIEENTPNDGSQAVVIPAGISTNNARIMVKADNSIFFALNQATLTIQQSGFALDLPTLEYAVCQPEDLEIPFTYLTFSGFSETTSFSTADLSPGLDVNFSNPTASADNTTITMTVSNTGQAATGSNSFTLIASASGGTVRSYPITINTYNDTFDLPILLSPANNSTGLLLDTALSWNPADNTTAYLVEVATDPQFATIIETATVVTTQYFPKALRENTLHYWRVTPINNCAQGTASENFTFTTLPINSALFENNTTIPIPPNGANTITSTIVVDREGDLNKLRVGVNISHTYIQDLTILLTSPNGTTITLVDQPCGDDSNIDVVFDDEGDPLSCGTNPALSGVLSPKEKLTRFKGGSLKGPWTLTVIDSFDADGGSINNFSIEVSVNGDFRSDSDGDGVFDENDQCPSTPLGDKVDINGCSLFSLPNSNYLIRTEGESCRNNEDGRIEITTEQNLEYTASLVGNNSKQIISFNGTTTFNNLSSGTYQLCFTVAGEPDYEQCFNLEVEQPEALGVLSRPDIAAKSVVLELSGSSIYFIELNGTLTTTSENRITLNLQEGINALSVSTSKTCQGIYREEFTVGTGFRVYPNPADNTLNIATSERGSYINISIYSITGRLLMNRELPTNESGRATTNISELPSGVYLLKIAGVTANKTIKLIKQ